MLLIDHKCWDRRTIDNLGEYSLRTLSLGNISAVYVEPQIDYAANKDNATGLKQGIRQAGRD